MPSIHLPQAVLGVTNVSIDSTTWAALALTLTVVGLVVTAIAWRRRGPASGVRMFAWALVPVALWLTGTLSMLLKIVNAVLVWATSLVFSPRVWAGIVVAGVAALLFLASAAMRSRGIGVRRRGVPVTQKVVDQGDSPYRVSERYETPAKVSRADRKAARKQDGDDEGMDEIEAILKKHGI